MDTRKEKIRNFIFFSRRTLRQGGVMGILLILLLQILEPKSISIITNITVVLFVVFISFVNGIFTFRAYSGSFTEMEHFIRTISHGDLTRDISIEKLGPLRRFAVPMNDMRNSLYHLVSQAKNTADNIKNSIDELNNKFQNTQNNYDNLLHNIQPFAQAFKFQSETACINAANVGGIVQGIKEVSETSLLLSKSSKRVIEVITRLSEEVSIVVHQMKNILEKHKGIARMTAIYSNQHGGGIGKSHALTLVKQMPASSNQTIAATMIESEEEIMNGLFLTKSLDADVRVTLNAVTKLNQQILDIHCTTEKMVSEGDEVITKVQEMAKTAKNSCYGVEEVVRITNQANETLPEVLTASRILSEIGDSLKEQLNQFKL